MNAALSAKIICPRRHRTQARNLSRSPKCTQGLIGFLPKSSLYRSDALDELKGKQRSRVDLVNTCSQASRYVTSKNTDIPRLFVFFRVHALAARIVYRGASSKSKANNATRLARYSLTKIPLARDKGKHNKPTAPSAFEKQCLACYSDT